MGAYEGDFDAAKPEREVSEAPEYEDPEPVKVEKQSKKLRRKIWKGIKGCTFPLWVVPFLFCKSSKFRTAAIMSGCMGWMFSDPGQFFSMGLWGMIGSIVVVKTAQKMVF